MDSKPPQTITETAPDDNLWAMDLAPTYPGGPQQPVLAHLIVAIRQEPHLGEVRTAACGREFTRGTHPRGWWGTNGRDLPLQDHAVHCGADAAGTFRLDRPERPQPSDP